MSNVLYRSVYNSLLVNKLVRIATVMFSTKRSYEEAIHKLNLLQSNKSTLEEIRREVKSGREKCTNLEDMENYLSRTGISLAKLDELSVIHVAGTKGKGSTSAMCESVLRHHGFRTGFYSSPHLVAVRERIRLEGRVITEDKFARHFHEVYDMLDGSKAHEGDMPKYFAFLTVLAYYMFLKESVDVAIVEVGIGGIVDYTNVLRKVPVIGISALGLDHTSILGNTIQQIAEAKAGVMKQGCEAYTVTQPPEAMAVLRRVAANVKCTLNVVPEYDTYRFPEEYESNLSVDLVAYRTNASLAIQLAHAWFRIAKRQNIYRRNSIKYAVGGKIVQNGFTDIDKCITRDKYLNGKDEVIKTLPIETVVGLKECKWPGRYHIIQSDYAKFYLDGAHTKESMEICSDWFQSNSRNEDKILIFSATGDRNAATLLRPLKNISFTTVYFVIPTAYKELNKKNDNYSAIMEQNELLAKCYKHAHIWEEFDTYFTSDVKVLECVSDALVSIKRSKTTSKTTSILVTGSLHLVGAALSILDPNLSIS